MVKKKKNVYILKMFNKYLEKYKILKNKAERKQLDHWGDRSMVSLMFFTWKKHIVLQIVLHLM